MDTLRRALRWLQPGLGVKRWIALLVLGLVAVGFGALLTFNLYAYEVVASVGSTAEASLIGLLALLIGVEVIGKVPATLHTPLMSGANSIHGIVIAGVVIVAAHATSPLAWVFIFLAAVLGTMNVVGGYVVTDRMLEMFKSDKGKKKEEEAK